MLRATTADLITVSPEAAGAGTDRTETRRTVYCTVKSIGQQEAYLALGQGLNPEIKIVLAHDFEYEGEGFCEVDGVRYEILRTYVTEADGIELTLQRIMRNAKPGTGVTDQAPAAGGTADGSAADTVTPAAPEGVG